MSYDDRIDAAIMRLQKQVGASVDGAWGDGSQTALVASGKKLAFNWELLRKHFGRFSQSQVDGFNSLLNNINKWGSDAINPLYAAYIFATTWHETAHTMQPVSEYGKGRTRKYGKWFTNSKGEIYGFRSGQGVTYLQSEYPHLYFGRGLPQLTWLDNYLKMGKKLGMALAHNPELANDPDISAKLMICGMLDGDFTGRSLSRCIKYGSYSEFVECRRIINGTDKKHLIAGYAVSFLECLEFE